MEQEAQVSEATEAPVEESTESTEASDRPEWLPEKFSDPADLGKAYKALESKLGEKEDDIRTRLMDELNEQASEGVPPSAGEYELPDFIDPEEAGDSDLLQKWADHCHENGYTHSEFHKGIEMYMDGLGPEQDMEAEAAQLGDNAEARIEAASLFANKFFPEEAMPAIERMCEGADGIIALEAMMSQMQDPVIGEQGVVSANLTEAELTEMMRDERYSGFNKDANYVKMINEGWQKLYGRA